MKAKVILNPYANRWGARGKVDAIRSAFDEVGMGYDLSITSAGGQARAEAAAAAADGYDAVIAAGGDGTVSEVVNGLISAAGSGSTRPLGIIPIGTGNDFNDMAMLPRDLSAAVRTVAAGKTRQVDAGRVTADGVLHHFDNNCALAMEPLVTMENNRIKKLSGNIRYLVALVKTLAKLKAWQMQITWNGGGYEGPAYLLSVCNSPRTGGLFCMAPRAKMDDGLLDFVFAPELSILTVLVILIRLFKGTHVDHPRITYGRSDLLTIVSEPGTPIHADGEVIAEAASRINYEILPGKITLLTP